MFALITALISGISIFVNSFGVKFGDPFIYTTLKNSLAVIFLFSSIFLIGKYKELLTLNKKQLFRLIGIGIIGGSIPFLLFFYGLKIGTASSASFIYRLLFIFAAGYGIIFLKEKISKNLILGAIIAILGNFLILGNMFELGLGELLVFLATILWAGEYTISKNTLKELSPQVVSFSRMFFGSLILFGFLFFTGNMNFTLTAAEIQWTIIASAFLFLFLLSWYSALKYTTLSSATAILTLGGPITTLLSIIFLEKELLITEAIGFLLLTIGTITIVGISNVLNSFNYLKKVFIWKV